MIKVVQLWKKDSRRKISPQMYLKSKDKLKETATDHNLTLTEEKQIEDEIAGGSTHRQNSKNW